MRKARKTPRLLLAPALILGAGLMDAQSARTRTVVKGQAQENREAESQQIAKGRMVFGESCIQCHSMQEVLIQRKSAQGWRESVYSMISRGAQLTPDEIEPLVSYLTATFGPNSPPPPHATAGAGASAGGAGKESLPAGAGKQILTRACVKCHNLSLVTASRKSAEEWTKTVARMVRYGAALAPADQQALVQYMATNFGGTK